MTEAHPHYQVWVNGVVYDEMSADGYPLTWSQQWDIAAGYREGLGG